MCKELVREVKGVGHLRRRGRTQSHKGTRCRGSGTVKVKGVHVVVRKKHSTMSMESRHNHHTTAADDDRTMQRGDWSRYTYTYSCRSHHAY